MDRGGERATREPGGEGGGVAGHRNKRGGTPSQRRYTTIDDVATAAIDSKGSGSALDSAVRAKAESHLGVSFDNVRVHQDSKSQQATAAIGARAFAHGSNQEFKIADHQ